MADEFGELGIKITASLSDFTEKMSEFEKILKGTEDGAKKTGGGFGEMAAGMLTAEAALGALRKAADFTVDSVKKFDEDALTMLRLSNSLGTEGAQQLEKLALAIEKTTRFSHDDTLSAANSLTIHKLNREEIEKLLPVINDYATKTGKSATSTAEAFGRAIEYGSTRGLRPFGIEIEKNGSQLEIYNSIIRQAEENVEELAKKSGDLAAGPLIKMKNEIAKLQEDMGEKLLPIFTDVVKFIRDDGIPVLKKVVDNFDNIIPAVKLAGEAIATYFAVSKITEMAVAIEKLAAGIKTLNIALLANPITLALGVGTATAVGVYLANKELDKAQADYTERVNAEAENKKSGRGIQFKEDVVELKKAVAELKIASDEEVSFVDTTSAGYKKAHDKAEALRAKLDDLNVVYDKASEKVKLFGSAFSVGSGGEIVGAESGLQRLSEGLPSAHKENGLGTTSLGKDKEFSEIQKFNEKVSDSMWDAVRKRIKDQEEQEKELEKFKDTESKHDQKRLMDDAKKAESIRDKEFADKKEKNDKEIAMALDLKNKKIAFAEFAANSIGNIGQQILQLAGEHSAAAFQIAKQASAIQTVIFTSTAIMKAMQEPLLPFPFNVVQAVAIGIQGGLQLGIIEAQQPPKYATGGYVYGPGHDAGGVMANLEGGEFIMNRDAVSRYGAATMAAINTGSASPSPSVSTPSKPQTTIVNVLDGRLVDRYLASAEGQRAIVNVIGAQRNAITRVMR